MVLQFVLDLICSVHRLGACIWFVFLFEVFLQLCVAYMGMCSSKCWLRIGVGGIFAGSSVFDVQELNFIFDSQAGHFMLCIFR